MPSRNIVFKYAISSSPDGYIMLGDSDYDYKSDMEIMELLRKYKKVMLDNSFNNSIDWLPSEITHLIIGTDYNRPISNLPRDLIYLSFEPDNYHNSKTYFSCELNLNHGIEELKLAINGKHTYLGDNLPLTLKRLCILRWSYKSRHMIDIANFPDSIEYLYIDSKCFYLDELEKLPKNLKVFASNDFQFSQDDFNYIEINKKIKSKFPNIEFVTGQHFPFTHH